MGDRTEESIGQNARIAMQTMQVGGASMITTLQSRADSVAPWPRRTEVNLTEVPIVSYVTKATYDATLLEIYVAHLCSI